MCSIQLSNDEETRFIVYKLAKKYNKTIPQSWEEN